ncbi:hypothetical protein [Botrimarina mediterranea]|uniref:Uncharacterized protein n=1 Tax=Botrimarina mediterranea TaxID=2528022 RepID=A0A518KDY4_9BACT|nr:hypothetical protein [Botrimarina mediterranea]QDV75979.1 hypothetical protein Spa11_42020 [Botrimarina mediterranea]
MARKAPEASPQETNPPPPRRSSLLAERYRLEGTYERLRRALISGPQDGRLDQPLSFWVLPTDRRLPIAFLGRTLRDLLAQPLEDLMQTPGVGQKKILGFFDLLRRAIKSESADKPFGMPNDLKLSEPAQRRGVGAEPGAVSDAVWREWCDAIVQAGFGGHALGRVAPSLRPLPTVIWETPLSDYAARSLSDIRSLKTHGEKRVNAIIEVFGAVYEAVSTAVLHEDLQLDLTARFVPEVSRWIIAHGRRPDRLTVADVREHVARPLVRQIDRDLGEPMTELVAERLGLDQPAPTVKAQAERLNVTRARVYQLLEDCARVMAVRWPEGRWLLAPLGDSPADTEPEVLGLVHALRGLFYPE